MINDTYLYNWNDDYLYYDYHSNQWTTNTTAIPDWDVNSIMNQQHLSPWWYVNVGYPLDRNVRIDLENSDPLKDSVPCVEDKLPAAPLKDMPCEDCGSLCGQRCFPLSNVWQRLEEGDWQYPEYPGHWTVLNDQLFKQKCLNLLKMYSVGR